MLPGFPSSGLETRLAKLQLRESGSWSFQDSIPKPELGNKRKQRLFHGTGRCDGGVMSVVVKKLSSSRRIMAAF